MENYSPSNPTDDIDNEIYCNKSTLNESVNIIETGNIQIISDHTLESSEPKAIPNEDVSNKGALEIEFALQNLQEPPNTLPTIISNVKTLCNTDSEKILSRSRSDDKNLLSNIKSNTATKCRNYRSYNKDRDSLSPNLSNEIGECDQIPMFNSSENIILEINSKIPELETQTNSLISKENISLDSNEDHTLGKCIEDKKICEKRKSTNSPKINSLGRKSIDDESCNKRFKNGNKNRVVLPLLSQEFFRPQKSADLNNYNIKRLDFGSIVAVKSNVTTKLLRGFESDRRTRYPSDDAWDKEYDACAKEDDSIAEEHDAWVDEDGNGEICNKSIGSNYKSANHIHEQKIINNKYRINMDSNSNNEPRDLYLNQSWDDGNRINDSMKKMNPQQSKYPRYEESNNDFEMRNSHRRNDWIKRNENEKISLKEHDECNENELHSSKHNFRPPPWLLNSDSNLDEPMADRIWDADSEYIPVRSEIRNVPFISSDDYDDEIRPMKHTVPYFNNKNDLDYEIRSSHGSHIPFNTFGEEVFSNMPLEPIHQYDQSGARINSLFDDQHQNRIYLEHSRRMLEDPPYLHRNQNRPYPNVDRDGRINRDDRVMAPLYPQHNPNMSCLNVDRDGRITRDDRVMAPLLEDPLYLHHNQNMPCPDVDREDCQSGPFEKNIQFPQLNRKITPLLEIQCYPSQEENISLLDRDMMATSFPEERRYLSRDQSVPLLENSLYSPRDKNMPYFTAPNFGQIEDHNTDGITESVNEFGEIISIDRPWNPNSPLFGGEHKTRTNSMNNNNGDQDMRMTSIEDKLKQITNERMKLNDVLMRNDEIFKDQLESWVRMDECETMTMKPSVPCVVEWNHGQIDTDAAENLGVTDISNDKGTKKFSISDSNISEMNKLKTIEGGFVGLKNAQMVLAPKTVEKISTTIEDSEENFGLWSKEVRDNNKETKDSNKVVKTTMDRTSIRNSDQEFGVRGEEKRGQVIVSKKDITLSTSIDTPLTDRRREPPPPCDRPLEITPQASIANPSQDTHVNYQRNVNISQFIPYIDPMTQSAQAQPQYNYQPPPWGGLHSYVPYPVPPQPFTLQSYGVPMDIVQQIPFGSINMLSQIPPPPPPSTSDIVVPPPLPSDLPPLPKTTPNKNTNKSGQSKTNKSHSSESKKRKSDSDNSKPSNINPDKSATINNPTIASNTISSTSSIQPRNDSRRSAILENVNFLETLMTRAGLSSDTLRLSQDKTYETSKSVNETFHNILKTAASSVISRLVEKQKETPVTTCGASDNMSMSPPSPPSSSPLPPPSVSSHHSASYVPPPLPVYPDSSKPSIDKQSHLSTIISKSAPHAVDVPSVIDEARRNKSDFDSKIDWQERVAIEVKMFLKPAFICHSIDKNDYKEIMKRCVTKITRSGVTEINTVKIGKFVMNYLEKYMKNLKTNKARNTVSSTEHN